MDSNSPAKPKLSAAEAKALKAARLQVVRLQLTIHCELDDRSITTPDGVGAALGMPAAEAIALLNRKRLREDDLARLQAAAAQLGPRM